MNTPQPLHDAPPPVPAQATPGLVALPGTGRLIWWTGRVAIGLRYQPTVRSTNPAAAVGSRWIQSLLLR
jgi:hypothetical protein